MMSEIEWTNKAIAQLIEEYRKRPQLWNKEHELYRAQTAKYEAWVSMASIFECEIADLRKKLNSIFASYRREKAKIRAGGKSTWLFYHNLNFLNNHLGQPVDNQDSDNQMEQGHTSEEQDADDYEEEVIVKSEPVVEHVHSKSLPQKLKSSKRLKRTVKRKIIKDSTHSATHSNHIDSKLLEMLRLLRKTSEISKKKDECDSFGEYIAVSLRKHDERSQSMIKQAINNILFEQEMKKYGAQYIEISDNPLVLGDVESCDS